MDTFPDYQAMTLEELFTQICKCCEWLTRLNNLRIFARMTVPNVEQLKPWNERVLTECFDEIRRRVEVKGEGDV